MTMIPSFRLTASFEKGIVVGSSCRNMTLFLIINYHGHWNRDGCSTLNVETASEAHDKLIIRGFPPEDSVTLTHGLISRS